MSDSTSGRSDQRGRSVEGLTGDHEPVGSEAGIETIRIGAAAANQWKRWAAALAGVLLLVTAFSLDKMGPFDEFLFSVVTAILVLFAAAGTLTQPGGLRA